MNVILFGPPGAGKGTQGDKISKFFNLHKVSTGDLLRSEVKKNTDLGKRIKLLIDQGSLVSNDIISNLIENILNNKKYYNQLVFDGFPRNIDQGKKLDYLLKKYGQKISFVFSLNVSKEIVIKRITGRLTCSKCGLIFNKFYKTPENKLHKCDSKFLEKRTDDNEDTVIKRFETYLEKTSPLINFYKEQKLLHEINATMEIDQIFEQIRHIMASLET